jgi:histidinol-phosphatase
MFSICNSVRPWVFGGSWVTSTPRYSARSGSTHSGGTTAYGDFWIHLLVAEGAADAALEPVAALWDLAPLKVIVEEAGGRFTDFRGTLTAAGPTAISSNGLLHAQVQELVQG